MFADKFSELKIVDKPNLAEDFGKYLAGKSSSYVSNKVKVSQAVNVDVPVNVSRVPQINVGDKFCDFVSSLSDEIVLVFRYGKITRKP